MRLMKTWLTLLPLALLSYSSTSHAKSEIDVSQPLGQTEDMATHTAFMVELVGKAREVNCNVPYTQTEQENLATTDPMVIVGAKLKQWVEPAEFADFMNVINSTMHCDSAQWVNEMNHQLSNSMAFKTNLTRTEK